MRTSNFWEFWTIKRQTGFLMLKPSQHLALILALLALAACNTRTKVEPCDTSYFISCAGLAGDEDKYAACLSEGSCTFASTSEGLSASFSASETSYTCNSWNPLVAALTSAGYSVTHTKSDSETVWYVDQFHNFFIDRDDVTYTIASAIFEAKPGDTIVLCPSQYPENLQINGEEKDNLKILNIAGGSAEMAEFTEITGSLGSTLEIAGAKGVQIKGLTFKDGNSSLAFDNGFGGGIAIVSFRDVTSADDRIVIQNSVISDNLAFYGGGGLFVQGFVDVYLDHVTFARNSASLGAGGAILVQGNDSLSKTVVCHACEFLQNSAYFSGNAIAVSDGDAVILQDATVYTNYPASDYSLAAVSLDETSQLYAQNVDWGSVTVASENLTADVFLEQTLGDELLKSGSDLWDALQSGTLTGDELESLYNEFLGEDGLLPGQYDFSGVLSVACQYGTFTQSCGEI